MRFKDVDLLLEVTPNVSQDRRIVMSIFITKNDVVDPTAPEPALSTNEAKTEILVEDGDTIVIGGILKDTKKLTDQGIPGLRKMPAMGWLFRSERVETSKNELLDLHHPAHHPAGAAPGDLIRVRFRSKTTAGAIAYRTGRSLLKCRLIRRIGPIGPIGRS